MVYNKPTASQSANHLKDLSYIKKKKSGRKKAGGPTIMEGKVREEGGRNRERERERRI